MAILPHKLPLISSNLRSEEAYSQILSCMQHLERVSNDVFEKIERKTGLHQKRLESVNERIASAEAKVAFIKGSKKAIRVFASSVFPASENPDKYESIFDQQNTTPGPNYQDAVIKSRFQREVKPPQKLQVLPLVADRDSGLHFDETMHKDGLGQFPANIKSVSSLLLFNTAQNPYSKLYINTDALGNASKTRKVAEMEPQTPSLDAAPASFTEIDNFNRQKDDLSYIPGFGDVPEFDLPNMLPDLPGVVEDFGLSEYGDDFGAPLPSMTPFMLNPPAMAVPELPTVQVVVPPPPRPVVRDLPQVPGVQPVVPVAPPAPPPFNLSSSGANPPLPPPPPPPQSALPIAEGDSTRPKPVASAAPDARSSLLESIRAAGGSGKAGLKSVKERKLERKKEKQEEKTKAVGGGDLMDDLKNRLTNLRKGISSGKRGNSDDSSASSSGPRPAAAAGFGSVMDQVSKMIPHSPTVGAKPQAQQPEEDDWD